MAKCLGTVTDWNVKQGEKASKLDLTFLIEDTTKGESLLNKVLETTTQTILNIANDYILIKQTVYNEEIRWNCTELRDSLVKKLKSLILETLEIASKISSSELISSNKHRYYIIYSSGVISTLQQLLQITGRLSDIDQRLYLDEQRNPFASNESVAIHALATIWSASIHIMNNFREPGRCAFEEATDSQEYNFVEELEFSSTGYHYAKVFLMDLIITSWIKFNRLVKFDDLVKGLPFLCPCQCKIFFITLKYLHEEEQHKLLTELLPLIIDYQSKPSYLTESVRQCNVVPFDPCYSLCDQQSLAYFVVWNLYSLSRIVKPADKPMISNCKEILEISYNIAMKQFEAITEQSGVRLSPHQEERHKLISHMKLSLD